MLIEAFFTKLAIKALNEGVLIGFFPLDITGLRAVFFGPYERYFTDELRAVLSDYDLSMVSLLCILGKETGDTLVWNGRRDN